MNTNKKNTEATLNLEMDNNDEFDDDECRSKRTL